VTFHATSRLSQCIFHIETMCCKRYVNVKPGNKRLQYCDLHLCRAAGVLGQVIQIETCSDFVSSVTFTYYKPSFNTLHERQAITLGTFQTDGRRFISSAYCIDVIPACVKFISLGILLLFAEIKQINKKSFMCCHGVKLLVSIAPPLKFVFPSLCYFWHWYVGTEFGLAVA